MLTRRAATSFATSLAVLVTGCGDDTPGTDAGAGEPDDSGGGALEIAAPAAAAEPLLTPCPTGWREVTSPSGLVSCDPWPAGGVETCAAAEFHFPGAPGCAPLGAAASSDGLPADLPADAAVTYVVAGATGGDGTRALPYGDLGGFAWGSLGSDAIVALGVGDWEAEVRLPRGVTLWGASVSGTRLMNGSPSTIDDGVVTVRGAATGLRNLTLAPSSRIGLSCRASGNEVLIEDVFVDGVQIHGMHVLSGCRLSARNIVVRGTRPRTSDALFGRALHVDDGAIADIEGAVFDQNHDIAASAVRGGDMTLRDIAILNTQSRLAGSDFGRAIAVEFAGMGAVSRAVLEHNREISVRSIDEGSTLSLTDVVIRHTEDSEIGSPVAHGIDIGPGAAAELARTWVEDSGGIGVRFSGVGSTGNLSDLVVSETRPSTADGHGGHGLTVAFGASVQVQRALLRNNRASGMTVDGGDTTATITDLIVRGTLPEEASGAFGRALNVQNGAVIDATHLLLEDNHESAVLISAGSHATLQDVVVRDTDSSPSLGTGGFGVSAQANSSAIVTRGLFERNRDVGVWAIADSSLTLEDLVVVGTLPRACAETTCPEFPSGVGLASFRTSIVSARRFSIRGSSLCGVQIARMAEVDLFDGEIADNPVGVCLQVDGYDTTRLQQNVEYRDNGANLQATEYPIPDPGTGLPSP